MKPLLLIALVILAGCDASLPNPLDVEAAKGLYPTPHEDCMNRTDDRMVGQVYLIPDSLRGSDCDEYIGKTWRWAACRNGTDNPSDCDKYAVAPSVHR